MRVLLCGGVDDAGVVEAVGDDADAGGEIGPDLGTWRWSALHIYIHVQVPHDIMRCR